VTSRPRILVTAVIALASGIGCGGGGGGGGVLIPETDNTPPTLGLLLDPEFGQSVAVGAGGANETTSITRRTGKISFLASAKDSESGVRLIQIWLTKATIRCDSGGVCTQTGPGLAGKPRFESDFGAKNPGDTTPADAIYGGTFEVEPEIGPGQPPPGGSLTTKLEVWAVSRNHRAAESKTAVATVALRETG
jgi:hypothetical protein